MKKKDNGKHRMGYINRTVNRRLAGLSIVELMVALTLLAIVSIAGLQIMQMSQSSFFRRPVVACHPAEESGDYRLYQSRFWGGMPGDPDVTTALTETINIAAHRRHCRID
jgi:hypothetical protein